MKFKKIKKTVIVVNVFVFLHYLDNQKVTSENAPNKLKMVPEVAYRQNVIKTPHTS